MDKRYFYIKDIDCTITIEYATRREMLEMIDEYVENCKTRNNMIANNNPNACYYDMSQDAFAILYKDGSVDIIDESFDGHHVKRQNIVSITNDNPSTTIVFGHFGLNECGVAEPTISDEIDESLKEVDTDDYTETNSTDSADGNNETATDSADGNDNETSTDNKTPAELKAEINRKYGVNAVYYDTDSILCDSEKQIVNVSCNNCDIKAYYDGKELTVPYSEYKCKERAIEYIKALYENRVVPYETIFTLHYGATAETMTILTAINTPDLIQYNIDDINVGLKTYYYKKVREGVERLCALIDDNHVCVVGFKYTKHSFDYAITKSKYQDCYNFKRGNNNWIQKPSEIARFIYFSTIAHEVELKYWHTIKEGETK